MLTEREKEERADYLLALRGFKNALMRINEERRRDYAVKSERDARFDALYQTVRAGMRQSPDVLGALDPGRVAALIADNWNSLTQGVASGNY